MYYISGRVFPGSDKLSLYLPHFPHPHIMRLLDYFSHYPVSML